jgi:hypothetical protein
MIFIILCSIKRQFKVFVCLVLFILHDITQFKCEMNENGV